MLALRMGISWRGMIKVVAKQTFAASMLSLVGLSIMILPNKAPRAGGFVFVLT